MYRHTSWSLATQMLLILGLSSPAVIVAADAVIWWPINERAITRPGARPIVPRAYQTFALDQVALRARLAAAPLEYSAAARRAPVTLPLPLPDGTFGRFAIMESPIMEPGLAAQFPAIKTYLGQGIDDPTAVVRFDLTPAGFHAMILSAAGTLLIDPYSRADTTHYISYFKRDYLRPAGKTLEEQIIDGSMPQRPAPVLTAVSGASLRTYRLAVAATGEYTAFVGGTVPAAMMAIITTINRVNVVYEREVSVRLELIAGNAQLVYTDGATDPYTNNNGPAMLSQNQSNLDTVIGAANYDIGHVFSTGGGGVATLGAVCGASIKARGVTGNSSPVGDAFDIDYVAHEIGHQFGANHTFNGTTGACGGNNRNPLTAYEPGSGSTIMAYAGICGAENVQPNSDDYFHGASFDEIMAFTTTGGGSSCDTPTSTGNSAPTVDAGGNYTIPARTPFTLAGSATDPNGDALVYHWEEFDRGSPAPPNTDNGNRPILRSFAPASSPVRTVPKLADILNNTTTFGESLPTTNRTMQFRLTARDSRSGGGGVANDSTSITIISGADPFSIIAPNTAVTWVGGSQQTVTWNVANTTQAPVNCPNVTILLSIDGGATFPKTLLSDTPNDGTQAISVPNTATTSGRIKVGCANNIFFDISNANFTIQAVTSATITAGSAPTEPSTNGSFTITLSAVAPTGGLTVAYNVATGGSAATPGIDYATLSGSAFVPAGAASATIPVTVLDDPLVDPGETISVTLAIGTGYAPGTPDSAGLIIGDNDLRDVTIAAGSVPAEPSTNGSFTITLSLPAPTDGLTITYSVATDASAATPGVDYAALSGSAFVPAGATTVSIPVLVIDDNAIDPNETVGITLTAGPGYTLGATSSATLTIGNVYRIFTALVRA
jgi:Metallo-peptidase family M12B Reprolysin-like/Calx-beta domain